MSLPVEVIKMSKITKLLTSPKTFFRDVVRNRKLRTKAGRLTYVIGFSTWKQYFRKFFPERNFVFLPKDVSLKEFTDVWANKICQHSPSEVDIFVWGFKAPAYVLDFAKNRGVKIFFVEDGFVRSVKLGATKTPPMSLCLDNKTPYFNANEPSDLEDLLNTFEFDQDLMGRAGAAMQLLLQTGVSKYNDAKFIDVKSIYGRKNKKRILVIGQVEDDASIKYGSNIRRSNNDLVRLAVKENPGAQIIYKPHPDVLNQHRPQLSNPKDVDAISLVVYDPLPLAQAFETVDHVYTQTSLAGFEALFRGIKVTVTGAPFYAGWGLTDDRQPVSRRKRKLSLEQLFAVAYLIYPKYFEPDTGAKLELEDVIGKIFENSKNNNYLNYQVHPSDGEDLPEAKKQKGYKTYIFGWATSKTIFGSIFDDESIVFVPENITEAQFSEKYGKAINSLKAADFVVGDRRYPSFLKKYMTHKECDVSYLNMGFVYSAVSISPAEKGYSYIRDSSGPHFDSRSPSELENILNFYDFDWDQEKSLRATNLLNKFVDLDISKYNHIPKVDNIESIYKEKSSKRVLILGQMRGAQSLVLANPRGYTYSDLVQIAAKENPGAQILFKPHPKAFLPNGRLKDKFDDLQRLDINFQIVDAEIPIGQALETIDQVYTISSLAGFEAIVRNIKTTVLGLPFYAGWGLADERVNIERRARNLTVAQVFAAAYLVYPIYVDTLYKKKIEPEEAFELIFEEKQKEKVKKTSMIFGDQEIFAKDPEGKKTAFLLIFHQWKQDFFRKVFSEYKVHYLPSNISASKLEEILDFVENSELIIWGYKESESISDFIRAKGIKVRRVEDGFVRSIALGAEHSIPASVAIDSEYLYFDSRGQSDLEKILLSYDFTSNQQLIAEARECIDLICQSKVSKYNHVENKSAVDIMGVKEKRRVLVVGQVEDDASIRFGCSKKFLNNDLVILARLENPDAEIFYKPHPDVIGGHREYRSDPKLVEGYAHVLYEPMALADVLEEVDHVYTITSLAGFEALIRGIKVTTIGCPFYSGWGLTDDRQPNERRVRKLSVEELFAGAYLLYPKYFDLIENKPCSAKKVIRDIAILRKSLDNWNASQRMLMVDLVEPVADAETVG